MLSFRPNRYNEIVFNEDPGFVFFYLVVEVNCLVITSCMMIEISCLPFPSPLQTHHAVSGD